MAVRRRLHALSLGILQPDAAVVNEMYMRMHSLIIIETSRLKICNGLKVDKRYTPRTPALVRKPSWSRREDNEDSWTLSRAWHASFLALLLSKQYDLDAKWQAVIFRQRTELLASAISDKGWGVSHYGLRTTSIVAKHLKEVVLTTTPFLSADISFHFGTLQPYEMRTGKQSRDWLVVW